MTVGSQLASHHVGKPNKVEVLIDRLASERLALGAKVVSNFKHLEAPGFEQVGQRLVREAVVVSRGAVPLVRPRHQVERKSALLGDPGDRVKRLPRLCSAEVGGGKIDDGKYGRLRTKEKCVWWWV